MVAGLRPGACSIATCTCSRNGCEFWDTAGHGAVRSASWSGRGWTSLFLHKLAEEERGGGDGMGPQGAHRVSGACPALCGLRGGCSSASWMVSGVQMTSFLRTVSAHRISTVWPKACSVKMR